MSESSAEETTQARLVSDETVGPALRKLEIEIPAEVVDQKLEEAFDHIQSEAALPGFRPGRAPRRLIERRFGSHLREDVRNRLLGQAFGEVVEEQGIEIIGEPDVKDTESIELREGEPLSFLVEVEVAPQLELPSLDQIEITVPPVTVTDEDVDKEIESFRKRLGEPHEKPDDPIEVDDFVFCDVHVFLGHDAGEDAEPVLHRHGDHIYVAGESRDYKGHVASIVIEDLGRELIGKKVGDEVRINATGPEQHEEESIRDQPITVSIALTRLQRVEPAPMEKLLEQAHVDSEEALRTRIREGLQAHRENEQEQQKREKVTDWLIDHVAVELPEGLTERQSQRMLQRQAMQLAQQGQVAPEQLGDLMAGLKSHSDESAQRMLKQFFILNELADQLEVEVSDEELNHRVAMLAHQQGRRPDKMRKDLEKEGDLDQLSNYIREQKTLDQVQQRATVHVAEEAEDQADPTEPEPGSEPSQESAGQEGEQDDAQKPEQA